MLRVTINDEPIECQPGTRDDCIVSVRPALDAPVNKGHLCVKGRYAFGFVHAADRITQPMIRESDGWRRTSWTEVRAFVISRLRELIGRYGADSIGVLGSARSTNEDNYLAQKFARAVIGTNNVDYCARVCHAPSAAGLETMLGAGREPVWHGGSAGATQRGRLSGAGLRDVSDERYLPQPRHGSEPRQRGRHTGVQGDGGSDRTPE